MAVPMMVLVTLIGIILLTSLQIRFNFAQVNNLGQDSPIKVTGNITTDSKDTDENWFSSPLKFLSHPLILVLIGSTASGLLIAFFTYHWGKKQKKLELDREERQKSIELDIGRQQKELELKTNLVDQISRSVASFVVSILLEKTRQITSSSGESKNPMSDEIKTDAIFNIYREWEISSRSISSQLSAYFLKTEIAQDWYQFHNLMNDFYSLVISDVGTQKKDEYKKKLRMDQFVSKRKIDWDNLTSTELPKEITALWQTGDAILDNSKEFVERIIKEEVSRLDRSAKI